MDWKDWAIDPALKDLLKEHASDDPAKLALALSKKKELPQQWLLNQITGKQIAKNKIPSWFACEKIVYPSKVALEQCSSELTAMYKRNLTNATRIADITGGLGVDTWAFSTKAEAVLYCEPDQERFEYAQHNFKALGRENIICKNLKAEDALGTLTEFKPDLIYIDPSRRDSNQRRGFILSLLQPDILSLKDELLKVAEFLLLKAAPMLDIKEAIRELKNVKAVHILSVKNECKELLFLIGRDKITDQHIHCVEMHQDQILHFNFRYKEEDALDIKTGPIADYLYDLYASVSKAGAFKSVCHEFPVKALHPNTHLYTFHEHVKGFPGRAFKVKEVFPYDPGLIRESIPDGKASLVFRNFPVSPAEVEKKMKMKSSAKNYLFFVSDHEGHLRVIFCEVYPPVMSEKSK